jgi:NAD(P)-dependent dehydrogenase (short-subunit alcohol dehydrogenase family)
MLREGASVLMTDINESTLATALTKVNTIVPASSRTGRVETKAVDVSSESQIEAAIAHLDSWGGLDVIFNNAGIMHPKDGDAEECPEDIWDRTMNINVKGVWFGSKHAVRSFRKHGKKRASVINTASMVALVGAATPQLAYTASKGAVLAMTRELAIVHAREGFRFNSLCPAPLKYVVLLFPLSWWCIGDDGTDGFHSTPLLQDWLGDDKEKRFRREVHFPSGRFGEAIEQAHAVVFLASDESSFVNATDFVVDGGLTKAYVTPEGPATEAPKNLAQS